MTRSRPTSGRFFSNINGSLTRMRNNTAEKPKSKNSSKTALPPTESQVSPDESVSGKHDELQQHEIAEARDRAILMRVLARHKEDWSVGQKALMMTLPADCGRDVETFGNEHQPTLYQVQQFILEKIEFFNRQMRAKGNDFHLGLISELQCFEAQCDIDRNRLVFWSAAPDYHLRLGRDFRITKPLAGGSNGNFYQYEGVTMRMPKDQESEKKVEEDRKKLNGLYKKYAVEPEKSERVNLQHEQRKDPQAKQVRFREQERRREKEFVEDQEAPDHERNSRRKENRDRVNDKVSKLWIYSDLGYSEFVPRLSKPRKDSL